MEDLRSRKKQLEEELSYVTIAIACLEGNTIWLTTDHNFSRLHSDIDAVIIAEGSLTKTPQGVMLRFVYDHKHTNHVVRVVRNKVEASPPVVDLSDSDSEAGDEAVQDVDPIPDIETITTREAIPLSEVVYKTDIRQDLMLNKPYGFFVTEAMSALPTWLKRPD